MESLDRLLETARGRAARDIAARLRAAGHTAHLVGGAVRDLLRGVAPADLDLTTSARPEVVGKIFRGVRFVGETFGVSLVRSGESEIEVATHRTDGPYSDGRRPDFVKFATLEEDLARRDFTVNAMALDLETGEIRDPFGGRDDLAAKRIRAVGDPRARMKEDLLRLLRAVRFAHRLGFAIEPELFAAIRDLAPRLSEVAAERIRDEATRILTSPRAGQGLELLSSSGLLAVFLPEAERMRGVPQPPEFHPEGDVWVHTVILLDLLEHPTETLAWSGLLHDIAKPATLRTPERDGVDRIRFDFHCERGAEMSEKILRRLRFSNDAVERVSVIVLEHLKFKDVDKMRPGRLLRWVTAPHFEELLLLHEADCRASHGDLSASRIAREGLAKARALAALPPRVVTGETLKGLGIAPGPRYKPILEAAYEAQLEGAFADAEGGIEWLRRENRV